MSKLKIVSIGDLHFGNPRIDAREMYDKLRKFFYPQLESAHLVTVDGDIYDQLLTVNSKSYAYATMFIGDLFRLSDRTGCQIRLLHGTYSHDRDQLEIFHSLATAKTRYKIISSIYSEVITDFKSGESCLGDEFSLRVGYIPDNLPYRSVVDVLKHLKRTMTSCDNLDVLIGHGTFAHTLPKNVPLPPITFTDDTFSQLVTGIVIMGHIHVHSKHNNIYYCGSFDRMSHNEEERKGFYSFEYDKHAWTGKFHVNTDATPFMSLNFTETDVNLVTRQFIDIVKKSIGADTRGYVRIIHPDPTIRAILLKVSLQQFPHILAVSRAPKDVEHKILKISDINLDLTDDVKPSKDNLGELVFQFLQEKNLLGKFTREQIITATNDILPE